METENNDRLDGFDVYYDLVEYMKTLEKNTSVSIVNEERVKQFLESYKMVLKSVKHKKGVCEISYKINEPFNNMASINIIGKEITIKDPDTFLKAAKAAANFEVYAKTDGSVQANLTFYGMTR